MSNILSCPTFHHVQCFVLSNSYSLCIIFCHGQHFIMSNVLSCPTFTCVQCFVLSNVLSWPTFCHVQHFILSTILSCPTICLVQCSSCLTIVMSNVLSCFVMSNILSCPMFCLVQYFVISNVCQIVKRYMVHFAKPLAKKKATEGQAKLQQYY